MKFRTLLLSAAVLSAAFLSRSCSAVPSTLGPAFSSDPQLEKGYRLLYQQQFPEARAIFQKWIEEHPDEPFGDVSLAASYLFEEFFLQNVLTSDYFLDDKRFLGGVAGTPNPQRMKGFQDSIAAARKLATRRLKTSPRDPEALYTMTLCAGMQCDADSILMKRHYDALKHLKEANASAEILLRDHPDASDAYVAPGIAYYVIGSLPASAQKTAEYGHCLKPFAQILLALSARREKMTGLAQKNLKALTQEFPGNAVYETEYAKAMGRPVPATLGPAH